MANNVLVERQLALARHQRQREFERILAERQERAAQEARARETGHLMRDPLQQRMAIQGYGRRFEDIPLTNLDDLAFMSEKPSFFGPPPSYYSGFESACRRGPLAAIQSVILSEVCTPTPAFLHHGLCLALRAGNAEAARYFLTTGTPILRGTPAQILSAPVDRQIPLFELFLDHGWTPNTPGEYGAVLLPSVLTNRPLLKWFLAHGADPNLGEQQEYHYGGSTSKSCNALEKAARRGDVDAVHMLLDAGALIQNGFPLHAAAGASPLDGNPHSGVVIIPNKEFDSSRIPAMALLVEHGADVNQHKGPQKGNQEAGYAIVEAVMAGAVERVRWLLEHGADPTRRGPWGSAADEYLLLPIMEKHAEELPLTTRPSTPRHSRPFPRLVKFLGFVSCLWLAFHWLPAAYFKLGLSTCNHHIQRHGESPFDGEKASVTPVLATTEKIPLEAHIMSKCPDARDCIRELVVPAMERVSDKVDFGLSFIASASNKSSDVECMHGPGECIGNMLMLCAANLPFPPEGDSSQLPGSRTPTVRYLGFATCLISSYKDIPDRTLVEQCALEHGIDFNALNECVSQQDDDPNQGNRDDSPLSGVALLRKSAWHSADLGIKTSCTVRLDDTVWCVRDGGVWKNCVKDGQGSQVSVLVDEIEKLWQQRN
ncbi:ankyrin repeats-domain-containing protein [Aspergillus crustosus]